ncbi:hypothetical protein [Halalkalibacterium halodurans]|uniref:dTDP-4-amino-4,6-dideoxygalactose transaminase n=2 Tax=Halalkalibacterium halodurans TaxID=86665 RepID=A0A0M0KGV1_ALKHA|nr:hypothetical protein [Halalkalibacterium halodurans]
MLCNNNERYEIGSHFDLDLNEVPFQRGKNESWLSSKNGDDSFTFSGRAAIEYAIKDIMRSRDVNVVYMPSYCCSSMVQPFINNGVDVRYYDVKFKSDEGIIYEVDTTIDCDIFFAMSYFGIELFKLDNVCREFSKRGIPIIEDITHCLLSIIPYSSMADYSVASIRKWFPIPSGGFILKHEGVLFAKPDLDSDDLINKKVEAMREKNAFLQGEEILKQTFMEKFSEFESIFKGLNYNYKIDRLSHEMILNMDINDVRLRRRKNAKILYEGLNNFKFVEPLIPKPDIENGCPLFVPIMVTDGKRDELCKYLIENKVYCPVHWPDSTGSKTGIQENELSLICDQRYTEKDMEFILTLIEKWHPMVVNRYA